MCYHHTITHSPQSIILPYKLMKFLLCYGLTVHELANSYVETPTLPSAMY